MDDEKWLTQESQLQKKFENIKINYVPCETLSVTVLRGRNISVGFFHDIVDTPDPQVYVACDAAEGRKNFKTEVARNQRNPEWNTTFTFVLSDKPPVVKVDVYEEDKFKPDPLLGSGEIDAKDLKHGETKLETISLGKHGEIDIALKKGLSKMPDFRLSLGLCKEEKQFRVARKPKTMQALRKVLGQEGPNSLQETPTIGVAISGGGYRAVATSCGAVEALAESNLLDTLMYISGLSGSSWYVSTTYLHRALGSLRSIIEHHDWLRKQMESSLARYLYDLSFHARYREYKAYKEMHGQPTTFVDFYGLALGETLLGKDYLSTPLSSLQGYVESGDVPYPILACAHVRDHLPMSEFWDEVEMHPYEISMPAYGINMDTKQFGSSWRNGVLQQSLPEQPLHYLMATSGSAFAIMWSKLDEKQEYEANLSNYIDSLQKHYDETGEIKNGEDESSDDDEDIEEKSDIREVVEAEKNFASEEDDWLEEIKRQAATGSKGEPIDLENGFNSRGIILQRTAKVKNCSSGYRPLSKFCFNGDDVKTKEKASKRMKRIMSTTKSNISLCDAALGCNLPSIQLLRPQRNVDVLICIDCGNYYADESLSLELFATVAKQAHDHGIKFPRVSLEEIMADRFREFYIFEDEDDPDCPVVLWFTLSNAKFRELENPPRRPGYPQPDEADEGKEKFNLFNIFPDTSDYGTLRLSFTPIVFDRLRELMRFNIMENIEAVKEKIAGKVKQMNAKTKQK